MPAATRKSREKQPGRRGEKQPMSAAKSKKKQPAKSRKKCPLPSQERSSLSDDDCELSDDSMTTVEEATHLIQPNDDQGAAEIIVKFAGNHIIKSQGRLFSRAFDSVIYKEGEEGVKATILNLTANNGLLIMVKSHNGLHSHYSRSNRVMGCIPRILAAPGIVDDGFADRLWQRSLGYLAYKDGVYSFKERRLMSIEEAQQAQIFFTRDTGRPFPHNEELANTASVDDVTSQELLRRVIKPFLPDPNQRTFFLNCIARALAGEILDKRWFVGLGARNCGKGIFCKLLKAAFGSFVRAMDTGNLLIKASSKDVAKSQSWMRDNEYTRILFSNEMSKAGTGTFDGETIKRLCSNGDVIEVRQNYKDEIQIRLQAGMFLLANDMPPIDLPDAYQTMHGFKFMSEFHEEKEITDPVSDIQKNWLPMDHSLEAFIIRPDVIDTFTLLILQNYTLNIQPPPDIVKEHTASIKGDAAESQEERFAKLVLRGEKSDVLFFNEIRQVVVDAGMGTMSDSKIEGYVSKLYGLKPGKPSKLVEGKMKQGRGFKHLRFAE